MDRDDRAVLLSVAQLWLLAAVAVLATALTIAATIGAAVRLYAWIVG